MQRCFWAGDDPLYIAYHDTEWGVPVWDERALFERLLLEGFQAGLSWRTILHKRDAFRRAFDGFEPEVVAAYGEAKIAALLNDPGIVRNRLKVRGAVQNARAWLGLRAIHGDVPRWLWGFVGGAPLRAPQPTMRSTAPEGDALSKALRRAGFTFVGPTICYAFMQSVGMVDDHQPGCFKYQG